MNVQNAPNVDPKQQSLQRKREELRHQAGQFEAIFVNLLIQSMRQTVMKERDNYLASGFQDRVFTDLFDNHIASRIAARKEGIGIAEAIIRQYEKVLRPSHRAQEKEIRE